MTVARHEMTRSGAGLAGAAALQRAAEAQPVAAPHPLNPRDFTEAP